jgi:hypothetical protein
MSITFLVVIGLLLLSVAGVLVAGVVSMAVGGDFNRKHGNQLMRWRVILQATTIFLLFVAYLMYGH